MRQRDRHARRLGKASEAGEDAEAPEEQVPAEEDLAEGDMPAEDASVADAPEALIEDAPAPAPPEEQPEAELPEAPLEAEAPEEQPEPEVGAAPAEPQAEQDAPEPVQAPSEPQPAVPTEDRAPSTRDVVDNIDVPIRSLRDRLEMVLSRQAQLPLDIEARHEVSEKAEGSPRETRENLIQRLLDPTLTLEEAAMLLGVCRTTVRRYTDRGILRCFRTPGNQRRFNLSDILDFMERQQRNS